MTEIMAQLAELHSATLAILSIVGEIKRQGLLMRREFRMVGDDMEHRDKRSPGQRTCIDKAVHLYVLHKDVNGDVDASMLRCCKRYWNFAKDHFKDELQYKNSATYDYRNFYDITAIKEMITSGMITF